MHVLWSILAFLDPETGPHSPSATNVVVVLFLLGGCCYQIFNVLRLFRFKPTIIKLRI